jgi:hypothetical protein
MILMKACPGVRLLATSAPSGAASRPLDEVLHHRQRDVRLEQRHAHLPQRVADVVLGDAAAPLEGVAGTRQAVSQVLEHGACRRRLRAGRSGGIIPAARACFGFPGFYPGAALCQNAAYCPPAELSLMTPIIVFALYLRPDSCC